MRPLGTEIREQVWVGEGANLADSVRVIGPTYIGARTIVQAGATIGPFASVEHDCVVGCGTTVERSTVLPYTYLAPGLADSASAGGRRIFGRSELGSRRRFTPSRLGKPDPAARIAQASILRVRCSLESGQSFHARPRSVLHRVAAVAQGTAMNTIPWIILPFPLRIELCGSPWAAERFAHRPARFRISGDCGSLELRHVGSRGH
jgi:carbonic anhydrase/acetyltransferase-like protein (isoleucine patch superfamily)